MIIEKQIAGTLSAKLGQNTGKDKSLEDRPGEQFDLWQMTVS